MTLGVVMTACKKEETNNASLEGNQWISEVFEAEGDFPAGMYLYDIGAKSGAGKMTAVLVATESNSAFDEGDLIKIYSGDYTYDPSTRVLYSGVDAVRVEYLSSKKIRFCNTYDGSPLMVLSLVEGRQHQINGAVEFEPEPEEFEITPSKEADWAGGSITFTSNRTIESLTYEVVTEGLTEQDICKTSLSDNTLTLGQYVGEGTALANCEIKVKATDEDGDEAECTVTSKSWRPAVYTKSREDIFTEDNLEEGWSQGQECWLGALCADGEIPYDSETSSFSGISYTVPVFMSGFGSKYNKVGYDTPFRIVDGTITYTYGALSFELLIEIYR